MYICIYIYNLTCPQEGPQHKRGRSKGPRPLCPPPR